MVVAWPDPLVFGMAELLFDLKRQVPSADWHLGPSEGPFKTTSETFGQTNPADAGERSADETVRG